MSEPIVSPQPDAQPAPARPMSHTTSLVLSAMFTVLVYVFTMIHVNPLGVPGGLIHLGNIPMFVGAILFGKQVGMLSGGIGMALFDVMSPYVAWAPFTLVIVGAMGFVVGLIAEKRKSIPFLVFAMVAACVIKVAGYYLAEGIIYGNWIAPFLSIPANITQMVVAAVVTLIIIKPLQLAADKIILRGRS